MKFEIGDLKLGKHKDVDALPNFKFQISSFDIGIQFDNIHFFEKSVNWWMKDAHILNIIDAQAGGQQG